jgi:hypothetical protein
MHVELTSVSVPLCVYVSVWLKGCCESYHVWGVLGGGTGVEATWRYLLMLCVACISMWFCAAGPSVWGKLLNAIMNVGGTSYNIKWSDNLSKTLNVIINRMRRRFLSEFLEGGKICSIQPSSQLVNSLRKFINWVDFDVLTVMILLRWSRSQWSRALRHELSSLARTVGSWVCISLETWMSVLILPCVGSGLATG